MTAFPVEAKVRIIAPYSRRVGEEGVVVELLSPRTLWAETLRVEFADGTRMAYSQDEVEEAEP